MATDIVLTVTLMEERIKYLEERARPLTLVESLHLSVPEVRDTRSKEKNISNVSDKLHPARLAPWVAFPELVKRGFDKLRAGLRKRGSSFRRRRAGKTSLTSRAKT
jgi:hypothetical protein